MLKKYFCSTTKFFKSLQRKLQSPIKKKSLYKYARAIKSDQLRRWFCSCYKAPLCTDCFPFLSLFVCMCVGTPKRPHTRLRQSPKWIIPRFGVAPLTPTLISIALRGCTEIYRHLLEWNAKKRLLFSPLESVAIF